MTFVFSPPQRLDSPHKKPITDVAFHSHSNVAAFVSQDRLTLWNLNQSLLSSNSKSSESASSSPIATVSSRSPQHFLRCAFIDSSNLAVLTLTNRIYIISLKNFTISDAFVEISPNGPIVFFQKVGKHIFVLTNQLNIIYVNTNLNKIQMRTLKTDSKIIRAQSTSESLFVLFENGQIAEMKLNQFEYLSLPTAKTFCVDKKGNFIHILTTHNIWQLWSLKDMTFIFNLDLRSNSQLESYDFQNQQIPQIPQKTDEDLAIFSPVSVSCAFFSDNSMKITHFSKVISTIQLFSSNENTNININSSDNKNSNINNNIENQSNNNNGNNKNNENTNGKKVSFPIFDLYGQTLLFTAGVDIYAIGLATAGSAFSDLLSAPITASHVLLPMKDMLYPVKLPENRRGRLALFGESALAVSTEKSVLILPFSEKICPSVSDGAVHSQYIKNPDIIFSSSSSKAASSTNMSTSSKSLKWIEIPIEKVRSFAWTSNTLNCLSGNTIYTISFTGNKSTTSSSSINNNNTNNNNQNNNVDNNVNNKINDKGNNKTDNKTTPNKGNNLNKDVSYEVKKIELREKPLSISTSGNKLLVTFSSQLSFYSIDTQKLVSTSSLGSTASSSLKYACFLSSETIAALTIDRKLLLIYHSKVHRSFDDTLGIQLTGSNGWPLFILGEKWRLLGANYSELDFDSTIENSLMVGVDGFSIFCIAPFRTIDFVHLVVCQSLSEDSMASAVSILSQLSETRRLKILQKVGIIIRPKYFDQFLTLIDRYSEIEDQILSFVFENNANIVKELLVNKKSNKINTKTSSSEINHNNNNNNNNNENNNSNNNVKNNGINSLLFDPHEFYKTCLLKGWFLTAARLIKNVDRSDGMTLLVKSEFDANVVKSFFNVYSSTDGVKEIEEEVINFYRLKFVRNDFLQIAELLPYFETIMKRFLLKTRRERESNRDTRFSVIIDQMKKCSRQQLIDLSAAFEAVNAIDLVFCCNFCVKNFAKCVECIERQQRMMKFIDGKMLLEIGYLE